MPGKSARRQITPERANWVIGLFVKAKANPKKISWIAKKAFLPVEDVKKILNRKASKREIAEKLKLAQTVVSNEQAHLKQFPIVVESAKMAMQQELSKTISTIQRMSIEQAVLEHELMRLAVGLDPDRHPDAKRKAIESAFVVLGVMQSGASKRIIPMSADVPGFQRPSVYASVFDRPMEQLAQGLSEALPEPLNAKKDAVPLYPQADPAPPPPEIESPPPDDVKASRIISVEVE